MSAGEDAFPEAYWYPGSCVQCGWQCASSSSPCLPRFKMFAGPTAALQCYDFVSVVIMSFKLSSGDIGPLICIAIKVIDALSSSGGATRHYREATAFLHNLKKTLEPLQDPSLLEAYPSSREQICQQVDKTKLAVEHFLKLAGKFEPDLGGTGAISYHQHIVSKLKWRFIASKALTELMTELSGYMRVLDTLLLKVVV